ncbi:recombinase RecT [Dokdonella sp.]|uniref:recombinase RecT n=1 Tax=Dokdonella sp. TaxID=2291710 RepID=UPI002DD68495|nr:recombinase RecT [Dokdonella sp.]
MTTADLKSVATGEKKQSPVAAFSNFMDKLKPQMALALPKHLTADRMTRLALTAFSTSEPLQRCTTKSIAASIMTAGQLGLEPGVNGAGFLVPYGTTCTFVPGWKGLVDLVSRSGRGTAFTGVIFKDQEYTFIDGAKRDLIIHNETDLDDPEDITHAYAIGWVKDATMPIIELWRVSKIKKHRDKYNKQGQKHYSFRDWEMYARKVPLLQVIKYMPCSIEVANAVALSEAADRGRGAVIEGGFVVEEDAPEGVDKQTGEIPPQLDHKQPVTIPQQSAQTAAADQWRPDPEEEAAIRAAELAESQRAAQPAPRQRRERGGLGLE